MSGKRKHVRTRCRRCRVRVHHPLGLVRLDEFGWCPTCAEWAREPRCDVCNRSGEPLDRHGWCDLCRDSYDGMRPEARCPHGNTGKDGCDACDVAGDLAYDTAREDRHFGR